jgi:hypothetical protein
MSGSITGDPQMDRLLKMTNDILMKIKKEAQ